MSIFIFGRKWNSFSSELPFTAENEKCFSVGLCYTSQNGLGLSLALEMQSLGLGLEY